MDVDQLRRYLVSHSGEMIADLERYVMMPTPSTRKELVDALLADIEGSTRELGADISIHANHDSPDVCIARFGDVSNGSGVALLCHVDTVWPDDEITRRPFRIQDGVATGPGVYDMKGGIVVALWSLRAIAHATSKPVGSDLPLTLVFNGDEEIGSPGSSGVIEEVARTARATLVLEPANEHTRALKTHRKGVGMFQVVVEGRAAHAGVNPDQGISAIVEMAHQILDLKTLAAELGAGVTLTVGTCRGGIADNVVPARAEFSVDLRLEDGRRQEEVVEAIRRRVAHLEGTRTHVNGGMNRPPFERLPGHVALYERAARVAAALGLRMEEGGSGGGSDGNYTSALGVPTLDGLGPTGGGAHAEREYVHVDELPVRAALLAGLLLDLATAESRT